MSSNTTVTLNDGRKIPRLGLGVFRLTEDQSAFNAVAWALDAGYRHIDTAAFYRNEKSVGQAVHSSGIPREQVFVTTKVWNDDQKMGNVRGALENSLKLLNMDYVDLYLLHWPVDVYPDSWKVLEQAQREGLARSIGVSNFQEHHLDTLLKSAQVVPAVNQIEIHPYMTQKVLRAYCRKLGIHVQAWHPLGGGKVNLLEEPLLGQLLSRCKMILFPNRVMIFCGCPTPTVSCRHSLCVGQCSKSDYIALSAFAPIQLFSAHLIKGK